MRTAAGRHRVACHYPDARPLSRLPSTSAHDPLLRLAADRASHRRICRWTADGRMADGALPGWRPMTAGDGDRRFRLGLAGAGRMGRTHLAALAGSRQVRVTGLAEPDPAARAAAARPGLPGFATVAELVAAGNLDGVLVAAPTSAHSPIVTEIAAAGLPVLCEKPCGLDTAQAQACAAAADRAGVLLQVAYWRRFVPELAALRQRIRAGELGRVLAVNCYQWDEAPPGAGFRGASGGIFADMGVHEFDQVRWLTGQEFGALRVAAARPDDGAARRSERRAGPASEPG